GIALWIDAVRLQRREMLQHALRERRLYPEELERREDSVPPEHGAEPRNAGVRISSVRRVGDEQIEIVDRAVEPIIELLVRRAHAALVGSRRDAMIVHQRECA